MYRYTTHDYLNTKKERLTIPVLTLFRLGLLEALNNWRAGEGL